MQCIYIILAQSMEIEFTQLGSHTQRWEYRGGHTNPSSAIRGGHTNPSGTLIKLYL